MENFRKMNKTELQNKMEGQSSRIEQTEDKISELKTTCLSEVIYYYYSSHFSSP
jgi:hypothetical protein